jgi:hypothetical protein
MKISKLMFRSIITTKAQIQTTNKRSMPIDNYYFLNFREKVIMLNIIILQLNLKKI